MERSVFVRAAYRLLERGQQIVVLISVAVVAHVAALSQLLRKLQRDLTIGAGQRAQLHRVQRFADVTAAAAADVPYRFVIEMVLNAGFLGHE